jgi:hypothetical protein
VKTYQVKYIVAIEYTRDVEIPDLVDIEQYIDEHADDVTDAIDIERIVQALNGGKFERSVQTYTRTDRIE